MKIKTSITLSDVLLKDMDRVCGGAGHRSAFVEEAVKARLEEIARRRRETKDMEILNRLADELNDEAEDTLSWQVSI